MTDNGSTREPSSNGRRRVKVLFLIDSLQSGGAERSLAEMLPGLHQLGVDPIIACLRREEDSVEDQVRGRFDLRFIQAKRMTERVRAVRKIIREERPDLVHTTLLQSDLLGRLAAAGTRTVVMSSLVNTPYVPIRFNDPHIRSWKFKLVQIADGWTGRRLTDHFHAVAHAVKSHAVDALGIPEERITVIERGRDASRLGARTAKRRRGTRKRLAIPADAEVLVNVGRQEFQKGQRYLLEAVERLAPSRPRLVLLIAGRRGAASDELDGLLARPQIAERVRLLGYRDDVSDVLAAADLFVFPSLFEGLGGSLIEAMALELPIVASDLDAIREVVEPGRNATLVPPATTDALATAIEELLDDAERARAYSARSRQIFEERFTLDGSTTRMAALYRRVLGDPAAKAAIEEASTR
jgi:glycosyltransferase involved in cell wall biosynthesis